MNNPFNNIIGKNKEKLLKMLEANIINYKKDMTILSTPNSDNIIGIIVSGYAQIIKTDYNGNRIIMEELNENSLIGKTISPLYDDECKIIAREDTQLIIIDYDMIFNTAINSNHIYNQFIKNMLEITTNQILEKNQRIQILTKKTIRNKLLEYFKIVSKKHGSRYVYLPFNFIDLADYLAVDRCAMSREIKNLKDEGIIEVKGKKITLLFLK